MKRFYIAIALMVCMAVTAFGQGAPPSPTILRYTADGLTVNNVKDTIFIKQSDTILFQIYKKSDGKAVLRFTNEATLKDVDSIFTSYIQAGGYYDPGSLVYIDNFTGSGLRIQSGDLQTLLFATANTYEGKIDSFEILNQTIGKRDIDSTANFVMDSLFLRGSTTADNSVPTLGEVNALIAADTGAGDFINADTNGGNFAALGPQVYFDGAITVSGDTINVTGGSGSNVIDTTDAGDTVSVFTNAEADTILRIVDAGDSTKFTPGENLVLNFPVIEMDTMYGPVIKGTRGAGGTVTLNTVANLVTIDKWYFDDDSLVSPLGGFIKGLSLLQTDSITPLTSEVVLNGTFKYGGTAATDEIVDKAFLTTQLNSYVLSANENWQDGLSDDTLKWIGAASDAEFRFGRVEGGNDTVTLKAEGNLRLHSDSGVQITGPAGNFELGTSTDIDGNQNNIVDMNEVTSDTLTMPGSTSGSISFKATATAGSTVYTWPTVPALDGYVLSSTTAGVMSWAAGAAGGSSVYVDSTTGGGGTNQSITSPIFEQSAASGQIGWEYNTTSGSIQGTLEVPWDTASTKDTINGGKASLQYVRVVNEGSEKSRITGAANDTLIVGVDGIVTLVDSITTTQTSYLYSQYVDWYYPTSGADSSIQLTWPYSAAEGTDTSLFFKVETIAGTDTTFGPGIVFQINGGFNSDSLILWLRTSSATADSVKLDSVYLTYQAVGAIYPSVVTGSPSGWGTDANGTSYTRYAYVCDQTFAAGDIVKARLKINLKQNGQSLTCLKAALKGKWRL